MIAEQRTENLVDGVQLDDLVKELDDILDAWFLGEVAPALEEARVARMGSDG
ncbi:MAG TPA: hypothetical protein VF904_16055 [Anaeromyxobacteraceae bacterium]